MNANGKRERDEVTDDEEARKKPKLHTNAALGAVLELVFDGQRRDLPYMPRELRDLIIDFTAPSPLRQLADDPTIPLFQPEGTTAFLSDEFESALWQVFHAFATLPNEHAPPLFRTMVYKDFHRFCELLMVTDGKPADSNYISKTWLDVMNHQGLPDRIERTELTFDGWCEYRMARARHQEAMTRQSLKRWADHLEPVHAYAV